ncbi:MAG: GntR family transcriptional regulator [Spirochaetales bacterium]|nr:GntR family transcriptional regulator [Spirochaetales bacterium]
MSKYSEIADVLKKEISDGRYSDTGRLPTEFELVSRFGVSRQTVRQAISSLKNDGAVYQVQGSGTYVSTTRSQARPQSAFKNVFIICTYISEYIFPRIVSGIESTLNGTGYRINLAATGNKVELERKILKDVIRLGECDGLIVEGSKTGFPNPNIALYQEIESLGIPMVFLHCSYQELPDSVVVGMDDKAGGKIASQKLIEHGCRNILGIFKSDDRQGLLRYAGFSEGIIETGLGLDRSDVRWYTTEDVQDRGMTIDSGITDLISQKNIDGIVCYNDMVASDLVKELTKAGIGVPKLVSFDDSYLAHSSQVRFESLGHRKEELGILAAEKIRNMIEGKKEKSELLSWIV